MDVLEALKDVAIVMNPIIFIFVLVKYFKDFSQQRLQNEKLVYEISELKEDIKNTESKIERASKEDIEKYIVGPYLKSLQEEIESRRFGDELIKIQKAIEDRQLEQLHMREDHELYMRHMQDTFDHEIMQMMREVFERTEEMRRDTFEITKTMRDQVFERSEVHEKAITNMIQDMQSAFAHIKMALFEGAGLKGTAEASGDDRTVVPKGMAPPANTQPNEPDN